MKSHRAKKTKLRKNTKFLAVLMLLFAIALPAHAKKNDDKLIVIIDAGHGGPNVGSTDQTGKIQEKTVTLEIAKKLGEKIQKGIKNSKVVYTRDKDALVTLEQRAATANKAKGTLFISLHVNDVPKHKEDYDQLDGFYAFILGHHDNTTGSDQAIRENGGRREGLKMHDEKTARDSYVFGTMVKNAMAAKGRKGMGVVKGEFEILSAVNMPNAILELDFISNPEQAAYMASKKGQETLADAIYSGVREYANYLRDPNYQLKNVAPEKTDTYDDSEAVELRSNEVEEREHISTSSDRRNTPARRKRRARVVGGQHDDAGYTPTNIVYEENTYSEVAQTVTADDDDSDANTAEYAAVGTSREVRTRANSGNVKEEKVSGPARRDKDAKHKSKKQTVEKSYTIQLMTSKDPLPVNSTLFKGYKVTEIHENNSYKYVYGRSDNKKTLEKELPSVKIMFRDAKIIEILQ